MNYDATNPLYNIHQTKVEKTSPGSTEAKKVVTELTVETALPLIVTGDPDEAKANNYLFLPNTATVKIIAYDLTISGRLSFPGRDVVIFTRILRAKDSVTPPAIVVDGVPPPDNDEQLRPALKQRPPQVDEGEPGSPSELETGFQWHNATWAGPGWSGPEHPDAMNGRDGKDGANRAGIYVDSKCTDQRGDAGSIFICCERADLPLGAHLELSANGGPGEPGQPGQDGAKGGRGGPGLNGWAGALHVGGPVWPTSGGRGGKGGTGGKGGDGGKGGKGGSITVHCISATLPVTCSVAGGDSQPGKGGGGGDHGEGGSGGKGSDAPERQIHMEAASPGPPGEKGEDGKGGASHPGDPGTQAVSTGDVAKAALASLASLAQLQMVFEAARGDYLVTPVPDYQLQMQVMPDASGLPTAGDKDTFLLAMIGSKLHIRIFDSDGNPSLKWAEGDAPGDAESAVNKLFAVMPLRALLSGAWTTPEPDFSLSAGDRSALVEELGTLTNQPEYFRNLTDEELIGKAAVAAFLLAAGIRDRLWFSMSETGKIIENHRNTLITEIGGRTRRGDLQGLTNPQLIGLGLGCSDLRARILRAERVAARDDALNALKQRFAVMPGVLLVGDWGAPSQKFSLAAGDRSALVEELGTLTNQPEYFRNLTDEELIGKAAVAAFLLAAGIRDRLWFSKSEDAKIIENHRNTLITEIGGRTGRGDLQGLTNPQLIGLGLEWFDWPRQLLGTFSDAEQQKIIQQIWAFLGYRDTWIHIGERLTWVTGLVSAIAKSGSDADKPLAVNLQRSVYAPLERYGLGLDYFGKTPVFAPALSFGSYDKAVDEAVGDSTKFLYKVDESNSAYFTKLQSQQDAMDDLAQAKKTYNDQKGFVLTKVKDTGDERGKLATEIGKLDEALRLKKKDLKDNLHNFEEKVNAAFGLSVETLFNCLSQLSFVNASEPVHALQTFSKVGGTVSAGAMAVSQIGTMINEAANNVLNDLGEPVRKVPLLRQVRVIEANLDLRTQFKQLSNDYISTDESKRLVVQLEKFRELCDQFRTSLKDNQLTKDLDDYIEAITKRNAKIDHYNALGRQRADLLGEVGRLKLQEEAVSTQLAEKKDPGLPAMAAYVSGLYERAKAEVVSDLYLLYRAYAFWALVPTEGFYGCIDRNPQGLDAEQLAGARRTIHHLLRDSVERTNNPPVNFPEDDEGFGRIVVLTRQAHGELFKDLEKGAADFEILPATKSSPAPASDFDPTLTVVRLPGTFPPDAETLPNPFYAMANVRLRKIRVWMVGMDTGKSQHYVQLAHTGKQRFRTPADAPYPSPPEGGAAYVEHGLDHEKRTITFAYDATELSFNAATKRLTPGSLKGSTPGLEDGDLKLRIERGVELPLQCEMAPIGPFGKWQLIINPDFNGRDKLNLKNLNMIVMDFHGIYQHFDQ